MLAAPIECSGPAASSFARASDESIPASRETMATLASPSADESARSTCSGEAPVADPTMRLTRARSFSFVAETSTMRLPKVLPSRIIETVESVFKTSFCAVPALSRVDPTRNSGPTTTTTGWSTSASSSEPWAETTHAVRAPARRAASIAPTTYGVLPLALTPTTMSSSPTARAATSLPPASRSSSAASCSRGGALTPPATSDITVPGGTEKVVSHSDASSAAILPDDPAPT